MGRKHAFCKFSFFDFKNNFSPYKLQGANLMNECSLLAEFGLDFIVHHDSFTCSFFLRSLHYMLVKSCVGFRLFRATGLAFAVRPKDGVGRQGRLAHVGKV